MGIETSCDETALALIDGEKVLANITLTQTIHQKYGGVFPMLAKREHAKNLLPIFKKILGTANFLNSPDFCLQKSRILDFASQNRD